MKTVKKLKKKKIPMDEMDSISIKSVESAETKPIETKERAPPSLAPKEEGVVPDEEVRTR